MGGMQSVCWRGEHAELLHFLNGRLSRGTGSNSDSIWSRGLHHLHHEYFSRRDETACFYMAHLCSCRRHCICRTVGRGRRSRRVGYRARRFRKCSDLPARVTFWRKARYDSRSRMSSGSSSRYRFVANHKQSSCRCCGFDDNEHSCCRTNYSKIVLASV